MLPIGSPLGALNLGIAQIYRMLPCTAHRNGTILPYLQDWPKSWFFTKVELVWQEYGSTTRFSTLGNLYTLYCKCCKPLIHGEAVY